MVSFTSLCVYVAFIASALCYLRFTLNLAILRFDVILYFLFLTQVYKAIIDLLRGLGKLS